MSRNVIGRGRIRQSNIELLRIICLLMVFVHHIIFHGITGAVLSDQGEETIGTVLLTITNSFCYIGVNIFMLITGYFGLKLNIRKLLSLYILLVFYEICYLSENLCLGQPFTSTQLLSIVFPISHSNFWFMQFYVIFFMLSPLINFENVSKRAHLWILVALIIVNVYMGNIWGVYNETGYNVQQFVFMYAIGQYMRRHIEFKATVRHKALCLYAVFCLLHATYIIASHFVHIPFFRPISYNNILMIGAAMSFFYFMSTFNFENEKVNKVAKSAVAIYLLQGYCLVVVIGDYLKNLYADMGLGISVLAFIGIMVTYTISALMIDQLRLLLSNLSNIIISSLLNIKERVTR